MLIKRPTFSPFPVRVTILNSIGRALIVLCVRAPSECKYINPVSYTHLDVYKRQAHNRGVHYATLLVLLFTSLLFTAIRFTTTYLHVTQICLT